jgi:hypothetical protein
MQPHGNSDETPSVDPRVDGITAEQRERLLRSVEDDVVLLLLEAADVAAEALQIFDATDLEIDTPALEALDNDLAAVAGLKRWAREKLAELALDLAAAE